MEKNWYVLFVMGGKEQQLCDFLNQEENWYAFYPKIELVRRKNSVDHIIEKPLFPSYIFVESNVYMVNTIYKDNMNIHMNNNLESKVEETIIDLNKYFNEALPGKKKLIISEVSKLMADIVSDGNTTSSNTTTSFSDKEKNILKDTFFIDIDEITNGSNTRSVQEILSDVDADYDQVMNVRDDIISVDHITIVSTAYSEEEGPIVQKKLDLYNEQLDSLKKCMNYLKGAQGSEQQIKSYLINLMTEIEKDSPDDKKIEKEKENFKKGLNSALMSKNADQNFYEFYNNAMSLYAEIDNNIDDYRKLIQSKKDFKSLKFIATSDKDVELKILNNKKDDKYNEKWIADITELKQVIKKLPYNNQDIITYHYDPEDYINKLNDAKVNYLSEANDLVKTVVLLKGRNKYLAIIALIFAVIIDLIPLLVGITINKKKE